MADQDTLPPLPPGATWDAPVTTPPLPPGATWDAPAPAPDKPAFLKHYEEIKPGQPRQLTGDDDAIIKSFGYDPDKIRSSPLYQTVQKKWGSGFAVPGLRADQAPSQNAVANAFGAIGKGLLDPVVGTLQLGQHALASLGINDERDTPYMDLLARFREENFRQNQGGGGTLNRALATAGSLAPAAVMPGSIVGGGLARGLATGAAQGAALSAVQPVTEANEYGMTKGLQVGTGAALGAGTAGLTRGVQGAAKILGAGKALEGAGATLDQVTQAAGPHPIDLQGPVASANEFQRLVRSGGSPAKVVRNFLQRVNDPKQPPLTFAEARDFYKNASRLSNPEYNNLNPVMKRALGDFRVALHNSLTSTAERAKPGLGKTYADAITQYADAAKQKATGAELKQMGKQALWKGLPIGGTLGGLGYYFYNRLFGDQHAQGGPILDRVPSREQILSGLRGYADGGAADDSGPSWWDRLVQGGEDVLGKIVHGPQVLQRPQDVETIAQQTLKSRLPPAAPLPRTYVKDPIAAGIVGGRTDPRNREAPLQDVASRGLATAFTMTPEGQAVQTALNPKAALQAEAPLVGRGGLGEMMPEESAIEAPPPPDLVVPWRQPLVTPPDVVPAAPPVLKGLTGAAILAKAKKGATAGYKDYMTANPEAGATMFDLSDPERALTDRPPDVPRVIPARGASPRLKAALQNPDVAQVLQQAVQEGGQQMPVNWYRTGPFYEHFQRAFGDEAPARYQRFMQMIAASSPRNPVPKNIATASYYNYLANEGLPIVKPQKGSGYGNIAQKLHAANAQRILSEGALDPLQNPKPYSFTENLLGNEQPVTIDTHNFRMLGMASRDPRFLVGSVEAEKGVPRFKPQQAYKQGELSIDEALGHPTYWATAPNKNEYGAYERWQQGQAQQLGLSPADWQGRMWVGGGFPSPTRAWSTGLASPPEPFLRTLAGRIHFTADRMGVDPNTVLRLMVEGKIPLLRRGGAVAKALP